MVPACPSGMIPYGYPSSRSLSRDPQGHDIQWPPGLRVPATEPLGMSCPTAACPRDHGAGRALLITLSHGSAMSRLLPVLLLAALGCAAKLRRQPAAWDDGVDGNPLPLGTPCPPSRVRAGPEFDRCLTLGSCPRVWDRRGAGVRVVLVSGLLGLLGVLPQPACPSRSSQPGGHRQRAAPT